MEKKIRKYNYYPITSIDYYSSLSISSIIIMWAFYIVFYYVEFGPQEFLWRWRMASISISVITIIFLIWRWHFFHVLYMRGVDVTGYIHSADAFKTGGSRVEYKYEYKGEKYWRGNALTHPVFFKYNFHDGDEVVLRIDPENPKWAVIKDIYF